MAGLWSRFSTSAANGTASAADDIRHKVVEEGWFGKKTTGDIAKDPATETPNVNVTNTDNSTDNSIHSTTNVTHEHSDLYESVWGAEPAAADLYGTSAGNTPEPAYASYEPSPPTPEPGPEPGV
jgi:hypothetical protein